MKNLFILLFFVRIISASSSFNYPLPTPIMKDALKMEDTDTLKKSTVFEGITLLYSTKVFKSHGFSCGYQSKKIGVTAGFTVRNDKDTIEAETDNELYRGDVVSIVLSDDICFYAHTSIGSSLIRPTVGFSIERVPFKKKVGFSPITGLRYVIGPFLIDGFYSWRFGAIYTSIGFIVPNTFFVGDRRR